MSTITQGDLTITPDVTRRLNSAREGGNVTHPILGSPNVDVTFRPARNRTGRLEMHFSDEVASQVAENAHATGGLFQLFEPARPSVEMAYVPAGAIARDLAETGQWILTVDYQEVTA